MPVLKGLDTTMELTRHAQALKEQGYDFALRSQAQREQESDTGEARALSQAGLAIGVVWETSGTRRLFHAGPGPGGWRRSLPDGAGWDWPAVRLRHLFRRRLRPHAGRSRRGRQHMSRGCMPRCTWRRGGSRRTAWACTVRACAAAPWSSGAGRLVVAVAIDGLRRLAPVRGTAALRHPPAAARAHPGRGRDRAGHRSGRNAPGS